MGGTVPYNKTFTSGKLSEIMVFYAVCHHYPSCKDSTTMKSIPMRFTKGT